MGCFPTSAPTWQGNRGCDHYRPKRSFGQGNIFTPVCHSVHRGGVPDQVHPPGPGTPPWDQVHPLGPGTPPRTRYPPGIRYTPLGPRYPPLDQVPPGTRYTHPPGTGYTPPGCKLWNTVNDRPVRILLECILVSLCLEFSP